MAVKRIVVVGCGSIGQRHARLLAKRPNLQIELCDPSAGCLAETKAFIGEVTCYTNFAAMLDTRPDLAIVATPHSLHADQVIALLDAGIHVLCEKPMSDTLSDAVRMAEAAACSPCILDFGFTLHFHPGLTRLRELILSGELGAILHMHCRVGTYATLEASRSRHQAQVEGALLLDYVHQPDILYWLSGYKPTGVYMMAVQAGDLPHSSNPNVADLVLDYEGDLRSSIHINYVQAPQRHEYEIVGDRAWVILDAETNCLRIGSRADVKERTETFSLERDQMFVAEHQAFLDAVEGKRSPESPPDTAIVSLQVVDAALTSWKQAKRIRISSSDV